MLKQEADDLADVLLSLSLGAIVIEPLSYPAHTGNYLRARQQLGIHIVDHDIPSMDDIKVCDTSKSCRAQEDASLILCQTTVRDAEYPERTL